MTTKRKRHELAILATDAYKMFHVSAYPEGTETVYSNMTPRNNSYFKYSDHYVAFGTEMFVERFLIDYWNTHFFDLPIEEVVEDFNAIINGGGLNGLNETHVRELHELGYLPIKIKALPEGMSAEVGIPLLTVENTNPKFFWLTNYLETQILSEIYPVMNASSTAKEYKKVALKWAEETCDNKGHIPFQFHDFSRRGHHGNDAGSAIAVGHLTSFMGTDSIQGSLLVDNNYGGDTASGNVYGSVMATEHSVASSYGTDGEYDYYKTLINKFPTGILSMVSDTYDYWNVLSNTLPSLKEDIMKRDGKIVIRPDSGNIIDVICGKPIIHLGVFKSYTDKNLTNDQDVFRMIFDALEDSDTTYGEGTIVEYDNKYWMIKNIEYGESDILGMKDPDYIKDIELAPYTLKPEDKGSLNLLWETFGGTINEKGYKVLDEHIGLIYGDSVNLDNVNTIFKRMEEIGFASSNVVLGVGALSYNVNNTRDTFGCAFKTTSVTVNGEERHVQKNPKTDKRKASAKGRLVVIGNKNSLYLIDNMSKSDALEYLEEDWLEPIFEDGKRLRHTNFETIRERIEDDIELNFR